MKTLRNNIFAASILGTSSASHEWRTAPCQYPEILDMIKGNEVGSPETIKIFSAFNESRRVQLNKLAEEELIACGFYS
jgi:hypothetical protein